MESDENSFQPDEPADTHWAAVDRAFDLYQDEPQYGEHLARVFRLFGLDRTNTANESHKIMGMIKNYFLDLLQQCSEEQFGQDAIEWAVMTGFVTLSYEKDRDVRNIMSSYDSIIDAYRKAKQQDNAQQGKSGLPPRLGPRRAKVRDARSIATHKRKTNAA